MEFLGGCILLFFKAMIGLFIVCLGFGLFAALMYFLHGFINKERE